MVSEWCMSLYLKTDHVHIVLVRSSVHLTMASTVEAQTVEDAKVCPRLSHVTGSP